MRQAGQRNEKMASKQKQQQQQHLMWKTKRKVAQEPGGKVTLLSNIRLVLAKRLGAAFSVDLCMPNSI